MLTFWAELGTSVVGLFILSETSQLLTPMLETLFSDKVGLLVDRLCDVYSTVHLAAGF